MAGKTKRKRIQKIIHVLHTIFEFFLKLKKAIGKSPVGHTTKKVAAKGKAATKSALNTSNPLINPISQVVTKTLATAGATITSSTATVVVIGAVIIIGGTVAYEYETNSGFSHDVLNSVYPVSKALIGNQNPLEAVIQPLLSMYTLINEEASLATNLTSKGLIPGSNSNNPLSIGIGTVNNNTNLNTINPHSINVGTSNAPTNNAQSSKSSATKSSSSSSGSGSSNSSVDYGTSAPSIDFEIPQE